MVELPEPPGKTNSVLGLDERLKSATVNINMIECDMLPLVAVTRPV